MLSCPLCAHENIDEASHCRHCGVPLVVVRASRYMDLAETNVLHGEVAAAQLNLDQATAALSEAGVLKRGQELITARAQYLQGLIYYHKGQTALAGAQMRIATALLEGWESGKRLLAEVLNTLGNVEYLHGNMAMAHDYYWRGLQFAEQVHAHPLVVRLWNNLGNISISEGRPYEALFRYNKAIQSAEIDNNPTMLAICYLMQCYIYIVIGPLSKGMDCARRLEQLLPQIEVKLWQGRAMIAIATMHRYCGNYTEAKAYLNMALQLADHDTHTVIRSDALAKLAQVYLDEGDYLAAYQIATSLFQDDSVPLISRREAASHLIYTHIGLDEFEAAGKYAKWVRQQEDEQASDGLERCHLRIAMYYAAVGDWNQASACYKLAISQARERGETFNLGEAMMEYARAQIAHYNAMSDHAHQLLTQAATIFRKIGAAHKLTEAEAMLNSSNYNLQPVI